MIKAKISDIFVSIQGEGKYLDQEQCFVRFYDCSLKCDFCDTKIYTFQEYTPVELIDKIKSVIGKRNIKSISITGGEPLEQRDFLLEFLPKLKSECFEVYLETNGVLVDELFDVIEHIDVISMDIKLPSSTKQKSFWQEHKEFLKIAKGKDVFVKTVICIDTTWEDFKQAVDLVCKINPAITFVLQPNSEQLGKELAEKLHEFKKYSKDYLSDVRAIPQIHKAMGVK
ncbi:MAG: 7-carboxy-7-deazaguanine synthase QueE [Candidatus Omnitrophica bacterium]|nr:7-carboxy-7-deazaguanine synthase QueE [Candidatus Omnitrophota bacterium]MDD5352013.1 7-carboxy-7-deazaguanine synthase QueE [Candidatus Omnitrophota bacterium]MDD5551067.1 7-carboxy-7-deazaguanine synthase QueE [Candidatus Omnitrophota bacterium]